MSRCCKKEANYVPVAMPRPANNCICSFPTLVVLILIVLQFSRDGKDCCDHYKDDCCGDKNFPVGNGILFIIALFFLSCASCGKAGYGAY